MIYAPNGLGYEVQARLVGKKKGFYEETSGVMLISCSESSEYEPLYFWIDGYKIKIEPDDYIAGLNSILE